MVEVRREKGLLARLFKKRDSVQVDDLKESIERNIPNMTFQEACEKTGRYINISIAPHESYQKSRLLNAIASPNVMDSVGCYGVLCNSGRISPGYFNGEK